MLRAQHTNVNVAEHQQRQHEEKFLRQEREGHWNNSWKSFFHRRFFIDFFYSRRDAPEKFFFFSVEKN